MSLPKSFTTVTPFSKLLALFLFITLPFLTFYLGLAFNPYQTAPQQQSPLIQIQTVTPSKTPLGSPSPSPSLVSPTFNSVPVSSTPSPQTSSQNMCMEGNTVRKGVKLCSSRDLDCSPLMAYEERFCRLPDGSCKFFCDQK